LPRPLLAPPNFPCSYWQSSIGYASSFRHEVTKKRTSTPFRLPPCPRVFLTSCRTRCSSARKANRQSVFHDYFPLPGRATPPASFRSPSSILVALMVTICSRDELSAFHRVSFSSFRSSPLGVRRFFLRAVQTSPFPISLSRAEFVFPPPFLENLLIGCDSPLFWHRPIFGRSSLDSGIFW